MSLVPASQQASRFPWVSTEHWAEAFPSDTKRVTDWTLEWQGSPKQGKQVERDESTDSGAHVNA